MQQVLEVRRYSHSMKEALTLSPRVATLSAGSARKCCLPRLVSATTSSSSSSKGSRREDMVRHSSQVRRPPSSHTQVALSCLVSGHWRAQASVSMFSAGALRGRSPTLLQSGASAAICRICPAGTGTLQLHHPMRQVPTCPDDDLAALSAAGQIDHETCCHKIHSFPNTGQGFPWLHLQKS